METKIWAKAIIKVNKTLGKTVEEIDGEIEELSTNMTVDAGRAAETVIDLMVRKRGLINLRVMCREMLRSMPLPMRRAVAARYIHDCPAQQLAHNYGMTMRSLYRLLDQGICHCAEYLRQHGFGAEYLSRVYAGEGLV